MPALSTSLGWTGAVCLVVASMLCAQPLSAESDAGASGGISLDGLSEETAAELSRLKFELDVMRTEAREVIGELKAKYDEALARLETEVQQAGELDHLLKVRSEREAYPDRKSPPAEGSGFAKLDELIRIFHSQLASVSSEVASAEAGLMSEFATKLDEMVSELTRGDQLEEAKALRDQVLAVREEIVAVKSGILTELSSEKPKQSDDSSVADTIVGVGGSFLTEGDLVVKEEGTLLLLNSAKAKCYIRSEQSYQVPFRFRIRGGTDSTNLRVYFGQQGQFIFNWERKVSEFRFHDPLTGKGRGYRHVGEIEKSVMHDIEVEMTDKLFVVSVDGEKRVEIPGEFAGVKGAVGVGPAMGSTVSVETFTASQLQAQ